MRLNFPAPWLYGASSAGQDFVDAFMQMRELKHKRLKAGQEEADRKERLALEREKLGEAKSQHESARLHQERTSLVHMFGELGKLDPELLGRVIAQPEVQQLFPMFKGIGPWTPPNETAQKMQTVGNMVAAMEASGTPIPPGFVESALFRVFTGGNLPGGVLKGMGGGGGGGKGKGGEGAAPAGEPTVGGPAPSGGPPGMPPGGPQQQRAPGVTGQVFDARPPKGVTVGGPGRILYTKTLQDGRQVAMGSDGNWYPGQFAVKGKNTAVQDVTSKVTGPFAHQRTPEDEKKIDAIRKQIESADTPEKLTIAKSALDRLNQTLVGAGKQGVVQQMVPGMVPDPKAPPWNIPIIGQVGGRQKLGQIPSVVDQPAPKKPRLDMPGAPEEPEEALAPKVKRSSGWLQ